MANLPATPQWGDVYKIEQTDRVLGGGGAEDIANRQAQALVNQNLYARKHGGALPFLPTVTYDTGDLVKLGTGVVVRSAIDGNTSDPNVSMTGWIFDSGYSDITQFELNEVAKTLRNYKPDPTAATSSQTSVLDYLQTFPLNPAPIQSPQGFANGGTVRIPAGRYLITSPIKLTRGMRIVGESHESTQIISRSLTGVFVFEDDGGYIPDEVALENLSIWQEDGYVPTSGAGLSVKEGAYTTGIQFILKNVFIQGAYKGFEAINGIACTLQNAMIAKCVSHGIDINNNGNNANSTTSSSLINCYTFLNGGNGTNIRGSSYVSMVGCASDSNTGYGYSVDGANTLSLMGGAERNGAGNLYIKDISSANVQIHSTQHGGAAHGIVLNNSNGLNLIGSGVYRSGTNTGTAIYFEANAKSVNVMGLTNVGYTRADLTNNLSNLNFIGLSGSLSGGSIKGGSTNNWTFGSTVSIDNTAQIANVGNAESTTIHGFKNLITYTSAGAAYNTGTFTQVATASTAITYPLVVGSYIENASAGVGSSITRSAGLYIKEQTRGATANANLMIDASLGTAAAGNWSIYNQSSRANYFGGAMTWKPSASAAPAANGDLTFEATSNTSLTVKLRGTDGVVRSAILALV